MLVSLLAELAIDYATLRASQERLSIADRNVVAARTSVELTEQRFARGLGNNLDVAQAQAQLQMVLSAQPPLRADIARMTTRSRFCSVKYRGGRWSRSLRVSRENTVGAEPVGHLAL